MRFGYIYVITNKKNNKKYVGQTIRTIEERYAEHCRKRQNDPSRLHAAMREEGLDNFIVEELEHVPETQLDDREIFWIAELKTQNPEFGYNISPGGKYISRDWQQVEVVENGLIFDSCEEFGRIISNYLDLSSAILADKVKEVVDLDKTFLNYHFKSVFGRENSSPIEIQQWAEKLSVAHKKKAVYCVELDKQCNSITDMANYLITNKKVIPYSKTPTHSVATSIGKVLHGTSAYIKGIEQNYTFQFIEGKTEKQVTAKNPFAKTKVYCPEIDKSFDSIKEAATYFVQNIWFDIVLKTACLRISDVKNGKLLNYKGYTFIAVN